MDNNILGAILDIGVKLIIIVPKAVFLTKLEFKCQ